LIPLVGQYNLTSACNIMPNALLRASDCPMNHHFGYSHHSKL
jgi:hypothetical protein